MKTNKSVFNPHAYVIDATPHNAEEAAFIHDFNDAAINGTLISPENQEEEKKQAVEIAKRTLEKRKKNTSINVRMNKEDVDKIKEKASSVGLPYQTLIGSILHQFAKGKIEIKL